MSPPSIRCHGGAGYSQGGEDAETPSHKEIPSYQCRTIVQHCNHLCFLLRSYGAYSSPSSIDVISTTSECDIKDKDDLGPLSSTEDSSARVAEPPSLPPPPSYVVDHCSSSDFRLSLRWFLLHPRDSPPI
ncbi:unnamed protein product [Cuscuta campestris]|uniref:Uncharacterized protein n=1 Tax=Cuscuta campestris TaxID=132261 RepID=A0A484L335_9ASTE|nr:unnamed protein product [Cuscuta campestris]